MNWFEKFVNFLFDLFYKLVGINKEIDEIEEEYLCNKENDELKVDKDFIYIDKNIENFKFYSGEKSEEKINEFKNFAQKKETKPEENKNMGDLTKNFSKEEFECGCGCGTDCISQELVDELQRLRDYIADVTGEERSFNITSGCRCPTHNEDSDGAPHSRHTEPNYDGADVKVRGLKAESVKFYACEMPDSKFLKGGIGLYKKYPGMIHLDVRNEYARWTY